MQRVILAFGAGATIACLSASGFITYQTARISDLQTAEVDALVEVAPGQPQNWLVVGKDNRAEFQENRTDTIMVVRVDPEATSVDILSLQRDLWVTIAGTGERNRINEAYGLNETPDRLIETIKLNFDLDINHYVEIDFRTFQGIVGAVGGVPMYFDRPMRDRHSGLHVLAGEPGGVPGCVTLDAEQALSFARSRHLEYQEGTRWITDPSADHGRVSRQQYFMQRMAEQAAARAANPKVFNDLVSAANEYVTLDQELDLDQLSALARRFAGFDAEAIRTWTLPTTDRTTAGGAMVLDLVPEGITEILNIFRGLDPHDADPRLVRFSVSNGAGQPGQAAQVQEAYRAIGYQAEVAGDAAQVLARTQVRHGYGGQAVAGQVERHLTAGGEIVADPTLDPGEVVLVTGADLTTVMRRPRPPAPLPPLPSAAAEPAATGTTGKARSTTTEAPAVTDTQPHNDGDSMVGVIPGKPPPGVVC